MNDIEFTGQFQRLIQTFGPKAFPQERAMLIHKSVIDLDEQWFRKLIDKMIGDLRFAPLVSDFRDAANKERAMRFDQEVLSAASRWTEGSFEGLKQELQARGVTSLTQAVLQERMAMRKGAK